jgi:general secretion pathway protein E
VEFDMDASELKAMGLSLDRSGPVRLNRGAGCVKCRQTGYWGRQGIFEVMPYSEALKKMTAQEVSLATLRARAVREGLTSLRENAVLKMLQGKTTHEEVLRVTWEHFE